MSLILAVLEKFYPGSWLPSGEEQIVRIARPYVELLSDKNGRLDYLETMQQWHRATQFSFSKTFAMMKTLPCFSQTEIFAISWKRCAVTTIESVSNGK
jgi:cyclopropane-fatty-acyl-phospholipid synthase